MKGDSFEEKNIQNTLKHRVRGRLDTLSRNIVTDMTPRHVTKVISGHGRSPAAFSVITFDSDQLER